jgi:hypothetical protein
MSREEEDWCEAHPEAGRAMRWGWVGVLILLGLLLWALKK